MPKIGLTIEEAEVVEWLVSVGDDVVRGQPLVVVNADKAELEIEAPDDGRLRTVVVAAGEVVAIAGVLCTLDPSGAPSTGSQASPGEVPGTDVPVVDVPVVDVPVVDEAARDPNPTEPLRVAIDRPPTRRSHRVASSPRARRVARDLDVDVRSIVGSGPGGRIVERDVRSSADRRGGTRGASVSATAHIRVAAALVQQRRARAAGHPRSLLDLIIEAFTTSLTELGVVEVTGFVAGVDRVRPVVSATPSPAGSGARRSDAAGSTFVVVDGSEHAVTEIRPELWPGCPLTIGVGSVERRPVVRGGQFDVADEVTVVAVADPSVWPSPLLIELVSRSIVRLESPPGSVLG